MSGNIELLSNTDNFTIGTNSNLEEILANVVKIGRDTSNVTLSIPQDISSSYNLILPVRQGASGESLAYGHDGQLVWHDPTVLKQVISVYGSNLSSNLVSTGTHSSPTYLENYIASITPKSSNSKIFVQFKVNYHAALSASNQISFYIKKTHDGNETIFSESLFGPYNGAGGFTGQYISNLLDQSSSTNTITYQLGYQINGNVAFDDVVGILGYDSSYNNSILLQEFEGSGTTAVSVWNKGADSNGLYYNDGTVHIGTTKNALESENTAGVALELSGNLLGTNANFSGNITAHSISVEDAHIGRNTLYMNGTRVLNQSENGSVNVYTDLIISEHVYGLNIKAIGDSGNIILDPSGTGSIQLNGDVVLSGGNLTGNVTGNLTGDVTGNLTGDVTGNVNGNLTGDVIGNVTGTVNSLLNHTTNNLSEGSTNLYYTAARVRSNVSGGTGINYNQSTGVFSLPQEVSTASNVRFNNITVDGTLNSDDITGTNVTVSNDLVVSGNLTVNGTRTIVNATTLDIGDNKIVVNAAGSITDAGIIANVSGTEHEFVYSTNNKAWGTTGDLNIGGNVTGNLTGEVTGNVTGNLTGDVTGNVNGNLTGDVTGNVTGNLIGDVTGNVTGNLTGNVTGNVNGNLTGDVTGNVTGNLIGDVTGNVTGNLTINGVLSATNGFYVAPIAQASTENYLYYNATTNEITYDASTTSSSSSSLTIDTVANATSTATRNAQTIGTGIFYQNGTQLRVQYKSTSSNYQDVLIGAFDSSSPDITILGDHPADVVKGTTYTDAGATAYDGVDGDVTSSITTTITDSGGSVVSSVDTTTIGTNYSVTYSVEDSAGNIATAIRTVNVVSGAFHTVTQSGVSNADFPNLWTTVGNRSGTTLSSLSSTSNGTDLQIKIEIITPTATFTMTYVGIPLNQAFAGIFTGVSNFASSTFTSQTHYETSAGTYTEQFSSVLNACWCLGSHTMYGRSHALNKRGIIIHSGSPPFPIVGNHIFSGNTFDGEVNLASNWTTINIYAN